MSFFGRSNTLMNVEIYNSGSHRHKCDEHIEDLTENGEYFAQQEIATSTVSFIENSKLAGLAIGIMISQSPCAIRVYSQS